MLCSSIIFTAILISPDGDLITLLTLISNAILLLLSVFVVVIKVFIEKLVDSAEDDNGQIGIPMHVHTENILHSSTAAAPPASSA